MIWCTDMKSRFKILQIMKNMMVDARENLI